MSKRDLRRRFFKELGRELHLAWPIVSGLVGLMLVLGVVIGWIEGWSLGDSVYFTFVTGLTIGFGDLVPKVLATRVMTIGIGACGILLTAMIAAVAVSALTATREREERSR